MWIPIIGWIFGAALGRERFAPVVQRYEGTLKQRDPMLVRDTWKVEEREIVDRLAIIVSEEIGWKYPRFMPTDPLSVVFWAHQDGLDDAAAVQRIEQEFGITMSLEESCSLSRGTMIDLVAAIRAKRANQAPEPTAPSGRGSS